MSVLGNIISAVFHHAGATPAPSPSATPAPPPSTSPSVSAPAKPSTTQASTPPAPTSPTTSVDVGAVLTKLAAHNKESLDWRHSIVDLMKLLNLDSSLAARKTLADELHYTGDKNNSAAMNVWLHQQVMEK